MSEYKAKQHIKKLFLVSGCYLYGFGMIYMVSGRAFAESVGIAAFQK